MDDDERGLNPLPRCAHTMKVKDRSGATRCADCGMRMPSNTDDPDDGQPDEDQEWHDFDPEC